MIFCKIDDLKKYKNVSRNLSTAIDFILQTDLHNLPIGKKKNLFAVIDIFEAHKPGILYNDREVIKCVFKVLADQE